MVYRRRCERKKCKCSDEVDLPGREAYKKEVDIFCWRRAISRIGSLLGFPL